MSDLLKKYKTGGTTSFGGNSLVNSGNSKKELSYTSNSSLALLREKSTDLKKTNFDTKLDTMTRQQLPSVSKSIKDKVIELVFIFDKSSSCRGTEQAMCDGFYSCVAKEKSNGYQTKVTVSLFSDKEELVYDRAEIAGVSGLYYKADGMTAIYDTVCDRVLKIKSMQNRECTKPDKTIVFIMTDGFDNESKRYDINATRNIIKERRMGGWEFIFLAANIDAKDYASKLGIDLKNAENYSGDLNSIRLSFKAISRIIDSVRMDGKVNDDWADELKKSSENLLGTNRPKRLALTQKDRW